jgi:hypothetical protein
MVRKATEKTHLEMEKKVLGFFVLIIEMHIERATMHCPNTACARPFDMGLTSAEDQKPDCFKWAE